MITRLLITMAAVAGAVILAAMLMPGVRIRRPSTTLVVAGVFGVLNLLLSWLLTAVLGVALIPAGIFTAGLVYLALGLLVNTALLWITDKLIEDFEIRSFWSLLATAGLIGAANSLVRHLA